jgi:hypothetical protein
LRSSHSAWIPCHIVCSCRSGRERQLETKQCLESLANTEKQQTHLHTRDDGKNLESWKLDVGKCKLETAKAQRQSWCKVETLRLGNRQNILPKTKNPSYALSRTARIGIRARATETVRENRILFTILLNDRVNCILSYYSGWRRSGPPRAPCCLAGPDSRSSNRGRCRPQQGQEPTGRRSRRARRSRDRIGHRSFSVQSPPIHRSSSGISSRPQLDAL